MVLLRQEMLQRYSSKLPATDCLTSLWSSTPSLLFSASWELKRAQDEYLVGLPTWRLSRASWPGLESPLPTSGSTPVSRLKTLIEPLYHSTPGFNHSLLGMRWFLVCLWLLWVHNYLDLYTFPQQLMWYSWAAGLSSLKAIGPPTPSSQTTCLLSCSQSYILGPNSTIENPSRNLMRWTLSRTSRKSRPKCKHHYNVHPDVALDWWWSSAISYDEPPPKNKAEAFWRWLVCGAHLNVQSGVSFNINAFFHRCNYLLRVRQRNLW